jgi:hypothetical protein
MIRRRGMCRVIRLAVPKQTAPRSSLQAQKWSYWVLSLAPTLPLPEFWLRGKRDKGGIISLGIQLRSQISQKYQDSSLGDLGNPPCFMMKSITDTH